MTTKIIAIQNDTNEPVKFERMEFIQNRMTVDEKRGAYVQTDIPWCLSEDDFFTSEKFIRVTLLKRNIAVYIWEAHGTVYMGKRYDPDARAIPGQPSTNRGKVLHVTADAITLHNASEWQAEDDSTVEPGTYFYQDRLAQMTEFSGTSPVRGISEDEAQEDLSLKATGWCRVYVRRNSAFRAGHVAFAFELDNGNWCVGGLENRWPSPISPPGANGYWVKYVSPDQINGSFLHNSQIPAPYDAYKSIYVADANLEAAVAWQKYWNDKPYVLYKSNCMDVTWNILKAYGAYLPDMTKLPKNWYDAIGAASQPLSLLQATSEDIVDPMVAVKPEALSLGDASRGAKRKIAPRIWDPEADDVATKSWFNSVALPFAGLSWPVDLHESGWRSVEVEGGFRPGTYAFLHTCSGISVVADRAKLDRGALGSEEDEGDTEILEWLPVISMVAHFLKFIGAAATAVANAWFDFEKYIGNLDKNGNQKGKTAGEDKTPAKKVHLPPPTQNSKKNQLPKKLKPRVASDRGCQIAQAAAETVIGATNLDGRLISTNPGQRGLAIVFQHADGSFEWMEITDPVRRACTLGEDRLNEVPPIRINSPETVTHVHMGWFEDPQDTDTGNASGGDIHGILDFWIWNGE